MKTYIIGGTPPVKLPPPDTPLNTSSTGKVNLTGLSAELIKHIISFCDNTAALNLSKACRHTFNGFNLSHHIKRLEFSKNMVGIYNDFCEKLQIHENEFCLNREDKYNITKRITAAIEQYGIHISVIFNL